MRQARISNDKTTTTLPLLEENVHALFHALPKEKPVKKFTMAFIFLTNHKASSSTTTNLSDISSTTTNLSDISLPSVSLWEKHP
jgi:hypothetical protein